jgi:hypothetical protein
MEPERKAGSGEREEKSSHSMGQKGGCNQVEIWQLLLRRELLRTQGLVKQ